MNSYQVLRTDRRPDWTQVPQARIDCYPWGGDYRPEAYGQLVYLPDTGFLARLACREEAPRAVFLHPDDMVCKDSCLEFFADFDPAGSEAGFLNCEANARGTLLCGLGPQRAGRRLLRELGLPLPQITPFRDGAFWGFELLIPSALLQAAYGRQTFPAGHCFTGNFYKCGDETAQPHFGVWNPISWPQPDFHRPEQFGRFLLG